MTTERKKNDLKKKKKKKKKRVCKRAKCFRAIFICGPMPQEEDKSLDWNHHLQHYEYVHCILYDGYQQSACTISKHS